MRRSYTLFFFLFLLAFSFSVAEARPHRKELKEWTFLIYLNGNNNLDRFGKFNINQMEKVGSTDDLNVVVQWASLENKNTRRLYVVKDSDTKKVTSPTLSAFKADMGDWRTLVDFIEWGAKNYPAKHYFVTVWNHGSGWRLTKNGLKIPSGILHPTDISWDDNTGHAITTEQLGQALAEGAKSIGQKIDLYGSDACLMAMAEIAAEVADSVRVFAGSEEVEPGAGWPYDTFLARWVAHPKSTAQEVGTYLTEEYVKSYDGGGNGRQSVTFSTFDLDHLGTFNSAVANLGESLVALSTEEQSKALDASKSALSFTYSDYVDLGDFVKKIETSGISGIQKGITDEIHQAMNQFVIANKATGSMSAATGVAIWFPSTLSQYENHGTRYEALKFNQSTRWADALKAVLN